MAQRNRVLKMTRVNLSELTAENLEKNTELFFLYRQLVEARRHLTMAAREAEEAAANLETANAQCRRLQAQFLKSAGEVSEKVATEPNWLPPFLNDKEQLCIESPFTLRDQRMAARAAHSQLSKAVQGEDEEIDTDGLFGDEEE